MLCFPPRQMYFTTPPCWNKNKNYFLLRQKALDERAAPGKCKNIAMQQQIELSLSIPVFFHPQQFGRPVLDCFLAFASLQGSGRALSYTGCEVFIHLLISMKFPFLSSFGGFIGIPSKYWFLVEMVDLLWESIPLQEDTFQTLCLKSEALSEHG